MEYACTIAYLSILRQWSSLLQVLKVLEISRLCTICSTSWAMLIRVLAFSLSRFHREKYFLNRHLRSSCRSCRVLTCIISQSDSLISRPTPFITCCQHRKSGSTLGCWYTYNNGLMKVVVLISSAVHRLPPLTHNMCMMFLFQSMVPLCSHSPKSKTFQLPCKCLLHLESSKIKWPSVLSCIQDKNKYALWIFSVISPFHAAIAIFRHLCSQYLSAIFFCFNDIASHLCNHKGK